MLAGQFFRVNSSLISKDDNRMLEEPVSLKEVKASIFGLGGEKAPGPGGFQAFFYQFFWDVIGGELVEVFEESRSGEFILKEFNCTLVALIPKKAKPAGFDEFCLISLCNIIYKIITKVATNRLKLILDKLISCEQSSFTPGRNIVDGVIVAHEEIDIAMNIKKRRMILKLDIRKAYNRVDRSFLVAVLVRFGFSKSWIKWISSMILKFSTSVLVNGSPQGFFPTSQGIRKGDPISPFLFILMVEVLGQSISRNIFWGMWKGIEIARGVDSTTHSQFADDTCLFGVASMHEATVMKKVLDTYSWATRQEINWDKSEMFFFHTEVASQREIARLFRIKIGQLPRKFLGMPLFFGVGKAKIWKGLLDGCKAKMEGWKSTWLSLVGRLLMLKTVVSAIPIFPMAYFKLPGMVIKNMQQKMRKFLWNGNQEQDKTPLMAWDKVCKPKGGGGAWLHDWRLINKAMGAKLVWQMYSKPEQRWVCILQVSIWIVGLRKGS